MGAGLGICVLVGGLFVRHTETLPMDARGVAAAAD
jgi:hypothetical protein